MSEPSSAPIIIATDETISSGTFVGEPTKADPLPASIALQGFPPDSPLFVDILNRILNNHGEWLEHFRQNDLRDRALREAENFKAINLTITNPADSILGYGKNVGVIGVHSSGGSSWICSVGEGEILRTDLHLLSAQDTGTTAFAQDDAAETVIGIGLAADKIWRSTDGGISWTEINTPSAIDSDAIAPYVFFDRFSEDWFIFLIASSGNPQIFKSTNDGATWTDLGNSTLTNALGGTTAIASLSNGDLFAKGSTNGTVYRSTNGGGSWAASASGLQFFVSLIELKDEVYALGQKIGGGAGVSKWNKLSSSWQVQTIKTALPVSSTGSAFMRLGFSFNGVAYALLGTNEDGGADQPGALAVSFDMLTWKTIRIASAVNVESKSAQARSVGGVHAFAYEGDANTILRVRTA